MKKIAWALATALFSCVLTLSAFGGPLQARQDQFGNWYVRNGSIDNPITVTIETKGKASAKKLAKKLNKLSAEGEKQESEEEEFKDDGDWPPGMLC